MRTRSKALGALSHLVPAALAGMAMLGLCAPVAAFTPRLLESARIERLLVSATPAHRTIDPDAVTIDLVMVGSTGAPSLRAFDPLRRFDTRGLGRVDAREVPTTGAGAITISADGG